MFAQSTLCTEDEYNQTGWTKTKLILYVIFTADAAPNEAKSLVTNVFKTNVSSLRASVTHTRTNRVTTPINSSCTRLAYNLHCHAIDKGLWLNLVTTQYVAVQYFGWIFLFYWHQKVTSLPLCWCHMSEFYLYFVHNNEHLDLWSEFDKLSRSVIDFNYLTWTSVNRCWLLHWLLL